MTCRVLLVSGTVEPVVSGTVERSTETCRQEGERSSLDPGDSRACAIMSAGKEAERTDRVHQHIPAGLRCGSLFERGAEVIDHAELGENDRAFGVAVEALDLAVS